jgi:signal transduction histidine kinase
LPTPANDDEVKDLAAAINRLADRLARYEREIRQSERLKTLGTLGGGIAHQVRNAATGCRIALDLHQRDCPLGANGHTDEEPLAVAVRQLSLIETHIQRLLALGRPSAMEKKPVALAEIVEQALSLVRPMAQHVGVKLAVETSPLPFAIEADSAALVQMLVNLLVNAVQAAAHAHALANPQDAADDPVVILRTEPVRRDRGRVAVGDPGPGPSGEIQGRLFEPFATDKPGGTGLGLVVARQIAEDHRGTIGWRREGERTWFFVELPLTPGTE